MKLRAFLLVSLFALGACASTAHTLSYPAGWPDADVMVGNQRYQVWFHGTDSTVLIQRGDPRPFGQLWAQNMTVYANNASAPEPYWRAAADAVLAQIGCRATEVRGADQTREASYGCTLGVNVGEAVAQHREQWRQGVRVGAPV